MKALLENKTLQILLGIIGIIITGVLMTHGLKNAMDIYFLDETSYLVRGTKMFGAIPKRWGPLYCAWYRILFVVENNLVDLFYLNYKLMAVIPSALLFAALTKYSKSVVWPLFMALCFLISSFNLTVDPKISFFCISLIFGVLYLSSYIKDNGYKTLLFLSTALLLSFARPEFYMSFMLTFGAGILLLVLKKISLEKKYVLPVIAFLLVAIVLHLGLGNPLLMKIDGHNRSIIAFGEHFAYNYSKWTNTDLYTWLAWEEIYKSNFGNADGIVAAMQANAGMFWKHIFTNTKGFFTELFSLITSLIIPFKLGVKAKVIIGILISLTALASIISNFKKVLQLELMFLFLISIPTLISCILVYPRNHYLVLLIPLIAMLLITSTDFIKEQKSTVTIASSFLLIAMFSFLTPRASDFKYFEMRKDEGVLNNQMAVELFKSVQLPQTVSMLSNEGDFSEFAKKKIQWIVPSSKKDTDFIAFLNSEEPDVIYLTQSIFKNPYYANDESWLTFLNNYENYGYEKLLLDSDIREYFLIKSTLLKYFK
ncbi:MAG: hypothetical protein R2728_06790 [Chitinophagales bacterium]